MGYVPKKIVSFTGFTAATHKAKLRTHLSDKSGALFNFLGKILNERDDKILQKDVCDITGETYEQCDAALPPWDLKIRIQLLVLRGDSATNYRGWDDADCS